MRSTLYECAVSHERSTPAKHAFSYRMFLFALDVDEIDAVAASIPFLSRNRWNVYSFHDADHLRMGGESLREDLTALLRQHGIDEAAGRIVLVTSLRVFGYVFNPVSFFFVDDAAGNPLAVVAEVNNTFGETKSYVLPRDSWTGRAFDSRQTKDFYISPFVRVDGALRLRVARPDDRLGVVIDSFEDGERVVRATLTGARTTLSAARLAWFTILYPLVTLKVIAAIHWHALLLFLKRVPFHRKSENIDAQRGMHQYPVPAVVKGERS